MIGRFIRNFLADKPKQKYFDLIQNNYKHQTIHFDLDSSLVR